MKFAPSWSNHPSKESPAKDQAFSTWAFCQRTLSMLFLSSLRLHTSSRFGPNIQLLAQFDFSHSRVLLCPWDDNNVIEHHHALVQVIHQFNLTSSKNLSWDTAPLRQGFKSVFTNHCDGLLAKVGELWQLWQNASEDKTQRGDRCNHSLKENQCLSEAPPFCINIASVARTRLVCDKSLS